MLNTGLINENVFTVYCDLVVWKGEFSSPKTRVETFFLLDMLHLFRMTLVTPG